MPMDLGRTKPMILKRIISTLDLKQIKKVTLLVTERKKFGMQGRGVE